MSGISVYQPVYQKIRPDKDQSNNIMSAGKCRQCCKITGVILWFLFIMPPGICQVVIPAENRENIRLQLPVQRLPSDTLQLWKMIDREIKSNGKATDSSMQFFMNALQQSQELGFHIGISASAVMLGQGYLDRSDYHKSIEMNLLALRYAPTNTYGYDLISTAYNNLGNAYTSLEKPHYAAYYYYRAAYILNTYLNGIRIEYIYCHLSNTLPGDYALYYLEKAEEIARKKGNNTLLCLTLSNKSLKYQGKDKYQTEEILAILQEALEISRKLPEPLYEYRILIRTGSFYLDHKDPVNALIFLKQAEQLLPGGDQDISHRNRDLHFLGRMHLQLRNYDQASRYFHESLKIAETLKLYRQMAIIYFYLAEIAANKGAFQDAYGYQKNYVQLKDSFLNETTSGNIQDLEIKYRTAEKDKEIAQKQQQIERRNMMMVLGGGLLVAAALIYYLHSRQKRKLHRQQQELLQLKALMKGEEIERTRIARELHDGIMVSFSSVKMNLGAIMKQYPDTGQTTALLDVVHQLDNATRELRKSAHNLMPDMLLREGLTAAVQYFCASISRNTELEIEFHHLGVPVSLPPDTELMLYRIIQELLQNALKYAAASHIIVQIDNAGDHISITVEDNGKGFDQDEVNNKEGFGLSSIRSRIKALGGTVIIDTSDNQGTSIYIEIETVSLHSGKNAVYAHNSSHRG